MISEMQFATSYSSFWRVHTPHLERFVRNINLGLTERISREVEGIASPERRAFVNEVAQRAFSAFFHGATNFIDSISELDKLTLSNSCFEYVSKLPGGDKIGGASIKDNEWREIDELCNSLSWYAIGVEGNASITKNAPIPGYGIIDKCFIDQIIGKTLIEVKAGDRNFRGIDVRQTLVYLALNAAHRKYEVSNVCLINPRRGIFFRSSVNDFVVAAAGKSSEEMFFEMHYFWTAGGVSK